MEMTAEKKSEVLTGPELCDWLKVGEKWVEKNTQARRIPGQFKAGKLWRYERAAIELQKLATGQVLLPRKKK